MHVKYKNALNEVSQIIDLLSEEYKNKISNSFLKFVEENKSKFNDIDIVADRNLNKQGISDEAKAILYLVVNRFLNE